MLRIASIAAAAAGVFVGTASSYGVLAYGLTDDNSLLGFDTNNPSMTLSAVILKDGPGPAAGPIQDLIDIDFRQADNKLYGVGKFGAVYTINPTTGVSTQVSQLNVSLTGSRFGIDFNPNADRLRIVSDADQNLAVNVDTGATVTDSTLGPGNPNVVSAAYSDPDTNVSTPTTLYTIDTLLNQVNIQNTPASGVQTARPVPLGFDVTNLTGFDIQFVGGVNTAFAALQIEGEGASRLYSINLTTGAATLAIGPNSPNGVIGGGDRFDGLAIPAVPEPTTLVALAGLGAFVIARRRA